jgi:hypothetical protein
MPWGIILHKTGMMVAPRSLSFFALTWIVSLLSSNLLPVCEASTYDAVKESVLKEEAMLPGSVLQNELRWAEDAIAGYNLKHNKYPLRSSNGGASRVMFSEEWFDDSKYHLENNVHKAYLVTEEDTPRKNLRG